MEKLEFKKRVGPDPHEGGKKSGGLNNCPDIWELSNGDFAIIGIRKTKDLMGILPSTAGCGPDEEIVLVPRDVLVGARNDIPKE